MRLILTVIPENHLSKFPPLFKPSPTASRDNFEFSKHYLEKDLHNFYPYFWYSPTSNLSQKFEEQQEKQKKNRTQEKDEADEFNQIEFKTQDQEFISLLEMRNQFGGTTQTDEKQIIWSGDCSARFRFRLVGLERIYMLFTEIQKKVATENRMTEPANVTLNRKAVYYSHSGQ